MVSCAVALYGKERKSFFNDHNINPETSESIRSLNAKLATHLDSSVLEKLNHLLLEGRLAVNHFANTVSALFEAFVHDTKILIRGRGFEFLQKTSKARKPIAFSVTLCQ
jgi:hypothetical protein